MRPSRRPCIYASFAIVLSLAAPRTQAKNLTIASSPPGARVEVNGVFVGNTPYKSDFPGGYFHKPHTVFGARLDRAMVVTISKEGYLSQILTITEGPFAWVSINGHHHGVYFLLKSSRFDIHLEPAPAQSHPRSELLDRGGPLAPSRAKGFSAPARALRAGTGTVAISSNPVQAEIYVDGQLKGQTPATLRLVSGLHHFVIKFSGDRKWECDLDLLASSKLTLRASDAASP